MELPRRPRGDELLKPGELARVRQRLRSVAAPQDLVSVIACAFDHRTRMLPLPYLDMKMVPAGVRAIGSAMVDCGFGKTRIVLQQWNRRFRPSQMELDGRTPDLFMVSSMFLHSAACDDLLRDACRLDPCHRPLIVAGGPKVFYEPWSVFHADPADLWGADVAVTGEEYVLLNLLEVLLSVRARGEPMRSAFLRARDSGALDEVPGLVYPRTDARGVQVERVDTGIQRLVGDLDELPHPVLGFQLLQPPSERATLGGPALAAGEVHRHSRLATIVLTLGCRLNCSYCPIPAYNQRQLRTKSGERVADEIEQLFQTYDIRYYLGADDNFLATPAHALGIAEALARKVDAGSRPHSKIRWATEATVHDVLKMRDQLATLRKARLWSLWLGVEDMTGELVRKGQGADQTLEAFRLLRDNGIYPVPMLMHHDAQPLYTPRSNRGLLNQLGMLRKAGALYVNVLILMPAPGSRSLEEMYASGTVFESVDGVRVEPERISGMYAVASHHPRPWARQLNLVAAYVYFFNPLRMLVALVLPKSRIALADAEAWTPLDAEGRPLPAKFSHRLTHKV
ncbi:MAG: radical SAM protein, partial [Armatimonadetes bacterium]|nr:radical SAM protein [Armatimonadota bacterium]